MFINIKKIIIQLAKNAVLVAESELGSGEGQKKKQLAINYIVAHLPFSEIVKSIISLFLSKFIDDAIEAAVTGMNSLPSNKGD